ncbi:MAG: WecB/TagA/CpsF family glycosyltransferase [Candidatus Actinomarina sp.]|tara:strand:+ start:711 stop:1445 length:735 start_codon:yes stop_codon:yes gene_type:complete
MKTTQVLKTDISETTISDVSKKLITSSKNRVAICNANTLVRSVKNLEIRDSINSFSIKTPDGFPVAKALSFLSKNKFPRVDGYKLFLQTISDGLEANTRHYFFGNNEKTTLEMIKNLKNKFPNINISGYICPENLSADDLASKYKDKFIKIDADIVWVSLGFPKQELFIEKIYNEINPDTNFVGIGGVFEWVAGTKVKAPEWLANIGLEWLFRLIQDPKRLYKRYLIDNTLFIVYFLRQVLFLR